MSLHPCIAAKVAYGTEGEDKLLPVLSDVVGQPLKKMKGTYSVLDFYGNSVFVELKKRTPQWSYTDPKIQKEGWLIPSCKILFGWTMLEKGKRVFFAYYWSFDKSLWIYELKAGDFTTGGHFVPEGHYDQMLHVAIPQEKWKKVEVDLSEVVFEEDGCWID